jgi:hypothetical protein
MREQIGNKQQKRGTKVKIFKQDNRVGSSKRNEWNIGAVEE